MPYVSDKWVMPKGVPKRPIDVEPGDVFYTIPGARRLLAVERAGVVVGYTTVRQVLWPDGTPQPLPLPTDTIEGAKRLGLGEWPPLSEAFR